MSADPAILVVESDRRLGEALASQLAADGFRVELARTVRHARMLASESRPELALLGHLESPRGSLELLEEIRRADGDRGCWDSTMPAMVIGGSGRELELLRAFEAGADDFLPMPLGYLELRARLRALLRRVAPPAEDESALEVGPLRVDLTARAASLRSRTLPLRRMEYELLVRLAREPDRAFAREELLREIWRYRSAGSTRTVDTHASRLRAKLRAADPAPWVVAIWGIGYRLR
ncbi:MAG TPA: response regulator transcription factor [Solirubrobacteraceae bacterium]|nr:response regulator transcription factor [Solirubrobacteraceae bacterium]